MIEYRQSFLSDLAVVFSGTMYSKTSKKSNDYTAFEKTLSKIGINFHDSAGWLSMIDEKDHGYINSKGHCGDVASKYQQIREKDTSKLLKRIHEVLQDQRDRVEKLESFVYMNCIGIQIEKYFSKRRSDALAGK